MIGLKPTRGLVSTAGFVPACRSSTARRLRALLRGRVAGPRGDRGLRRHHPYSRADDVRDPRPGLTGAFRFAVPAASDLEFEGDADAERLYREAVATLEAMGGTRVEIDYAPFLQAGALLYEGPWVADRLQFLGRFLAERGDALHPVTREIIAGGGRFSAVEAFAALDRLELLSARRRASCATSTRSCSRPRPRPTRSPRWRPTRSSSTAVSATTRRSSTCST